MDLRAAWKALWGGERKAPTFGPLLGLPFAGQPIWTPRRYDKFADEGYRRNVVAFRAINEVTRAAASVPWILFQNDENRTRLDNHPLIALLRRPNPLMAQDEFVETVIGFLLIAGNSYIEAVGPDGAVPRELWPLRPDRVRVIAGKTGLPKGYSFTVGGHERRWTADPITGRSKILHLRTFNPLDDWYGMSPIEAAAHSIDQRNAADSWNMSLLQNGARPSGAMIYEPREGPANLSDQQYARLKAEIGDQYAGAGNAGRPMLLDGGLKWQDMSLSPKDMDFLESKNTTSRDIALAFGVPPQLLGIPGDNTYSNYQEARLALWEETIIPLLCHLRGELNNWLAGFFGDDLRLDVDLDEVPALVLRRERRWRMLQDADFLTINEKRKAVGLGAVLGGDEIFVERQRRPLGQPMGSENQ